MLKFIQTLLIAVSTLWLSATVTTVGNFSVSENATYTLAAGDTLIVTGTFTAKAKSTIVINGVILGTATNKTMTFKESCNLTVGSTGIIHWLHHVTFESKMNVTMDGLIRFEKNLTVKEKTTISGSGRIDVDGTFKNEETTSSIFGCTSKNAGCCGCSSCCLPSTTTISPLPIELIQFKGKLIDGSILIEWTTASELNNDYFEIEKLGSGLWNDIGRVYGSGTSNENHRYSFVDFEVKNETMYYRLKQVDFDGDVNTSNIIKVDGSNAIKRDYRIYKTNDKIEFVISDNQNNIKEIKLINLQGVILEREVLLDAKKGQTISFDLSQYPSGLYSIQLLVNDVYQIEKILHLN